MTDLLSHFPSYLLWFKRQVALQLVAMPLRSTPQSIEHQCPNFRVSLELSTLRDTEAHTARSRKMGSSLWLGMP